MRHYWATRAPARNGIPLDRAAAPAAGPRRSAEVCPALRGSDQDRYPGARRPTAEGWPESRFRRVSREGWTGSRACPGGDRLGAAALSAAPSDHRAGTHSTDCGGQRGSGALLCPSDSAAVCQGSGVSGNDCEPDSRALRRAHRRPDRRHPLAQGQWPGVPPRAATQITLLNANQPCRECAAASWAGWRARPL